MHLNVASVKYFLHVEPLFCICRFKQMAHGYALGSFLE